MIKKAFFYTVLSLTYAIGNGFLSIAENILIKLEEKSPPEQ
jgi:hypothetical protein